MSESAPQPAPHPVAAHLKSCGITVALIIDDAYDPPTQESLRDDIPVFWDQVVRDSALHEELKGVAEIGDQADIDDAVLKQLYERLEQLPKLGPVCKNHLFATKLEKLAPLELLRQHLESLDVRAVGVGSEEELPKETVKLIFIDYFLGPGDDANAVAVAQRRAAEVYGAAENDADKPFIVLMSSKPDAVGAQDMFRETSGLLGGLFGYVSKDELRDRDGLYLRLFTWAIGLPARHTIQRFVEALEASVEVAAKEFRRRVRALGFEDYANIQWLSLQAEGHPLGDYMLWLYKSLIAHLLHNHPKVLDEQKKLDRMSFKEFTRSQFGPSLDLADAYRYALTEPGVGPLGAHPQATEGSTEPYLELGDLFFTEHGTGVLVVLNAACDLAYSPGNDRPFPGDRFILLVQGELQHFEEPAKQAAAQTDLFKHDGRVYRILWTFRNAVWKEYRTVAEWLRSAGYTRRARFALPYALELQRAFAAHFTRIGMPVKPPLVQGADVEVFFEGETNGWEPLIELVTGGARVITRKMEEKDQDEELFILTPDCIGRIVNGLAKAVERCVAKKEALSRAAAEAAPAEPPGGRGGGAANGEAQKLRGQIQGVDGKLDRLGKLQQNFDPWMPLIKTPHGLPAVGRHVEIDKQLMWVYRDYLFEGNYKAGPPIVIHVRTRPAPPPADTTAPTTGDTAATEAETNA